MGIVEIVIPFNGTNSMFQQYYIVGRTFTYVLNISSVIGKSFTFTADERPDLLI